MNGSDFNSGCCATGNEIGKHQNTKFRHTLTFGLGGVDRSGVLAILKSRDVSK